MDDNEFNAMMRNSIMVRRRLAVAMLDAIAAGALEKPPTAEDVADWKKDLADCDAELAELDNAQRP